MCIGFIIAGKGKNRRNERICRSRLLPAMGVAGRRHENRRWEAAPAGRERRKLLQAVNAID